MTRNELLSFISENVKTSHDVRLFATRHAEVFSFLLEHTKFLPENSTTRQRIHAIENGLYEVPSCKACSNTVKFYKTEYALYCSKKCSTSSVETKEKSEKTSLSRYGHKHHLQSNTQLELLKSTNKQRYGVEFQMQRKEAKEKRVETYRDRYGVDNPSQSEESLKKRVETNQKKYGVMWAVESEEVKEKVKNTINSRSKFGHHLRDNWDEKTAKILQCPESLRHCLSKHQTAIEVASHLGVDVTTIMRYIKKYNISYDRSVFFSESAAERELYSLLKSWGLEVIRRDREIIAPYEVDLFIPEKKLAIEYCGLYWHSDAKKSNNYHYDKYRKCLNNDIKLLTIFEDEWQCRKDQTISKIAHKLGVNTSTPIYGRLTECNIGDVKDMEFVDECHIQGKSKCSFVFNLTLENSVVAVMSFLRDSSDKDTITLNRYCSKRVIGGFNKLLKFAIPHLQRHGIRKVVTFSDNRWDDGSIYEKSGFSLDVELRPGYYYVKNLSRIHKFALRKPKLKGILTEKNIPFNDNDTEIELSRKANFNRIYDCGKKRWILDIN